MPKSHYEVIGAAPTATAAELRKAYLSRARRLHPDQFANRPAPERAKAEQGMKELNQAWGVLSDRDSRRAYDLELGRTLQRGTSPLTSGRTEGWKPFDPGRPATPRPKPGPKVADERDMEIRGFARLMRPGPLLAIFAILVTIIVIATVATGGGDSDDDAPRTEPVIEPTGVPIGCLDLTPVVETVPCGGHDAVIWSTITAGESCPDDLESAFRQDVGGLYCFTRVS